MTKKRRLHPLEIAARNASFDILGYIQKKYKEAITKHYDHRNNKNRDSFPE